MVKEYGYEYDAALEEEIWKATGDRVTGEKLLGAHCLRSGRDALKAIAREFAPCLVLLPALACDSMVRPFRLYGHRVRFYKLHKDYSIDLDSLDTGTERTLFLYMDYFGRQAVSDEELRRLRERGNLVFLEDRTHTLLRKKTGAFQPDYSMASLRKWLPIPDGGLLWGPVSKPFGADTAFSSARLRAQCLRHAFLSCGEQRIKTQYRKIFSTVSALMDTDGPSAMSAYACALAKKTDWQQLRDTRRRNAEALLAALSASPHVSLIQDTPGRSDLYVPFTVPRRDEVQRSAK